ncbi:MAG: hypothetical protein IT453_18850 [Planctomycetes bacterium]|nr:hypothetical protein [Planctomycetota bacterium]
MQEVQVSALVEAFYDLCPNDPNTAAYFKLPAKEQARVMHQLLLAITRALGGGDLARGKQLMARWQNPAQMTLELPNINGHPFLTEKAGGEFLARRAVDVDFEYGGKLGRRTSARRVTVSKKAPCPNCVPRPPLHLSNRSIFLDLDGAPLMVEAPVDARGKKVRAHVGVRMTVMTHFDPVVEAAPAPGRSTPPVVGGDHGDHDHSGHDHGDAQRDEVLIPSKRAGRKSKPSRDAKRPDKKAGRK